MTRWTASTTYEAYVPQYSKHKAAVDAIVDRITSTLAESSVPIHAAYGRAKEPLELYKKLSRKTYENPWTDCPDILGARVIVPTSNEKSEVVDSLQLSPDLTVLEVEDQTADADPNSLQYRGLHVHVSCADLLNDEGSPMRCEVQVRTTAEHAWSETNHRFIYKKPIPLPFEIQRTFSRLLALVELFDQELAKGAKMVSQLESFRQLEFARELENTLNQFTSAPNDLELTLQTLHELVDAGVGDTATMREQVDRYLSGNRTEIEQLLSQHGPDTEAFNVSTDWFLSQAEFILTLALLNDDEFGLSSRLQGSDLYPAVEALALRTNHGGFVRAD